MSFSKLRKIHIIIIGALVCVLVATGVYFVLVKKATERLAAEKARYEKYVPTGTQQNIDMAKADLAEALQEVAEAENKLERYMRTRMPNLNLSKRDRGMIALWHEQSEVLGPLLIRWIRQSGVTLASSIAIPAPPSNPNDPVISSVPIRIPIGRVRVQGDFRRLMDHLRKWNSCSRLVMVDSPSLSGQSPNLACEYDMTVYIFPRQPAGETIPMAGTPGAGGATPGGVMPGGMPMSGPMPGPPMPAASPAMPSPGPT